MAIDIAELMQPIAGSDPCGEDASFSDAYDRIREARRADDASLSQGDWQTELKTADWRAAAELAAEVLQSQSKDLQAAVWLGEALIARHGLAGAADAMDVLHGLLDTYWDGLHPRPDGDDLEERASKLAWFNSYGGLALKKAPLTASAPYVTLIDWQDSREVDNLARQNAAAYQEALDAGKPTGESVDKAIEGSGPGFVSDTLAAVDAAQAAFDRLQALVDQRFGRQAPSLADLGDGLKRARQVLGRAAQNLGIAPRQGQEAGETAVVVPTVPAAMPAPALQAVPAAAATMAVPRVVVDFQARAELLRTVGEIAAHFKRVEPHSPVSFLLERAVSWADMPLDQWLAEVVSDDSVLGVIRDRIGVPRG